MGLRLLSPFVGRTRLLLFNLILLGSATIIGSQHDCRYRIAADDQVAPAADDSPGTAAWDPSFSPAELNVPEGFEYRVVAAPPLVSHPTFATFDDFGRLFVCENAGVNLTAEQLESQLPNSIYLLTDRDQDGVFDHRTVFADNMTFPMGGAWLNGSLFVASPPNIWRLTDTDGDGVADSRKVIVDKFGYTGNAASIHGCFNGPDGRIYWCDGYHGHEFRDASGTVTSQREGSYLFSCNPDGSDVRLYCGGGMDNPVEVDFTDSGDMIGTVNIMYTRPRVDCLVHWLHGGVYPHRERVREEVQTTGDWLDPIHRFGHVAVSGTMRYRSGALSSSWQDNFFATFFNSGRVVRLELSEEGSSYHVRQREFLSSSSDEFHPTDLVEDADGSLLVVDTGGWFYRGCPTSQFSKPDIRGAIYRVRRKNMPVVDDPRGSTIAWNTTANTELIALMGDPRAAVRELAIRQLAARGSQAIPDLLSQIGHRDARVRLGCLWCACRIAEQTAEASKVLVAALDDSDSSIVVAACNALTTRPTPRAANKLSALLSSDSPTVRRVSAQALGRLGEHSAIPLLINALQSCEDRNEQHALIFALIEINHAATTRTGLSHSNPDVQLAVLQALDQMDSGDLSSEDVMSLVEGNPQLQPSALTQIWMRHSPWKPKTRDLVEAILSAAVAAEFRPDELAPLVAWALETPPMQEAVTAWLAGNNLAVQRLALDAILRAPRGYFHPAWRVPLVNLLGDSEGQNFEKAFAVACHSQAQDLADAVLAICDLPTTRFEQRFLGLHAFSGNSVSNLAQPAFELALATCETGNSVDRQPAILGLASAQLSAAQLVSLSRLLPDCNPSELPELIRPFERNRSPEVANALLDALEDCDHIQRVSSTMFSDIIKRYPKELLPRANRFLQRLEQLDQLRIEKLDRYIELLPQGDSAIGKELFHGTRARCATCHQISGQGRAVGPDLSTIGANRSENDLLESILFPSASIVRDYESYSVATEDGRVLAGLLTGDSSTTIRLQTQEGATHEIRRDAIEVFQRSSESLMPGGLEETLSDLEMVHILRYLTSLTGDRTNTANPSVN